MGSIHQYKLPVEVVAATIPRRRRESRTDDPPRNSNKVFRTWLDCCYVFNVICGGSPRQKVLQVSLFQSGENLLAQRRNRRISTHHTSLQCQSHDDKSMRCLMPATSYLPRLPFTLDFGDSTSRSTLRCPHSPPQMLSEHIKYRLCWYDCWSGRLSQSFRTDLP